MSGNRVEELESRVEELEASISGLTDELMETKARLAELEDESTDEYIEAGVGTVEGRSGESTTNEEANPDEDDSADTDSSEADDIIVA